MSAWCAGCTFEFNNSMEMAFAEQEAGEGEMCKDHERRERGDESWWAMEQEEQAWERVEEREQRREERGDVLEDDGKEEGNEEWEEDLLEIWAKEEKIMGKVGGWNEDFLEMWERNEDSREEVLRSEKAVEEWMREERRVREGAGEGEGERAT